MTRSRQQSALRRTAPRQRLLSAAALVSAASVAIGLAGSFAGAVPAASADTTTSTTITADLSNSTGPITYGATGALYGVAEDGVPSDNILNGLKLQTLAAKAPNGAQHPNGDALAVAPQWLRNGGDNVEIYMKDIYTGFPYPKVALSDYLAKVRTMVTQVKNDPNASKFVFLPFNEPDYNDPNYGTSSTGVSTLIRDWTTVYRTIKEIMPTARIGGMNYASYNSNVYRQWLTSAKANNTLPDVTTWHELSGVTQYDGHYSDYRAIEKSLGISPIPIDINEYALPSELAIPGQLMPYIARFENTKVDGALPYWYAAGDMDFLATHNNQATGAWWLYHWYGLMTGNTVKVNLADPEQATQAVATYDASTKEARVLFGGAPSDSTQLNPTLVLKGLNGTALASGAHVTVYGVDSAGRTSLPQPLASPGPSVVAERGFTASDLSAGSLTMSLNGLQGTSAYYAIVTPATSASPVVANRYEAEYARATGTATPRFGGNTGYNGTGYVDGYQNSSTADTTFFVTAANDGYYDVSLRYSAGPLSGVSSTRKLNLRLNGSTLTTLSLPGTSSSSAWKTTTQRLYLPAGINRIELAGTTSDNTDAVALDYVQVNPSATNDATTIEAEATGNTVAGAARRETSSGASGGSIVSYIGNGTANYLQFNNVTAAQAGDYTLTFAYAQNEVTDNNAFQTVVRKADISVNGGSTVRVPFANTRNWNDWWTTSIRVTLKQGSNTIRVSNASAFAPNLDKLTVASTIGK